jgi:hypothetical protein
MNYTAEDAFVYSMAIVVAVAEKKKIKQQLVVIVVDRLLFAVH